MQNDQTTPTIIMYTTSWCGFCRSEKQYFESNNIPYVAKDVEADRAAYDELMSKTNGSYVGVPITDIGGEMILGFDLPKIEAAIKKHGITPKKGA